MREKFKILQEDDQKMYNKWVKGIAKQDAPSQVITVNDVINRYRNTISHEMIKQLPYGIEFLLNQLGDIFSKTTIIRTDLSKAIRNPVISEHKHRIESVNKLNDKMDQIQQILFSCTEDMNKIIENPKKDDKV